MFARWKEKAEAKRAKEKAIAESQYWKNHDRLRICLQAMRGSCTVAPAAMHEAAIAVVNIAMQEDCWTALRQIPADYPGGDLFLVWDDEKLPVLKAPWALARENIREITAVSAQTFLVAGSLDRILWFDGHDQIRLYSIS